MQRDLEQGGWLLGALAILLHLAEFKPIQASRKIVNKKSVESGSKNLKETFPHETGLSGSQSSGEDARGVGK